LKVEGSKLRGGEGSWTGTERKKKTIRRKGGCGPKYGRAASISPVPNEPEIPGKKRKGRIWECWDGGVVKTGRKKRQKPRKKNCADGRKERGTPFAAGEVVRLGGPCATRAGMGNFLVVLGKKEKKATPSIWRKGGFLQKGNRGKGSKRMASPAPVAVWGPKNGNSDDDEDRWRRGGGEKCGNPEIPGWKKLGNTREAS